MNKVVQYHKGFLKHIKCDSNMFSEGSMSQLERGLEPQDVHCYCEVIDSTEVLVNWWASDITVMFLRAPKKYMNNQNMLKG